MAPLFLPPSKFSCACLLAVAPRVRTRAPGYLGRQLNPPAVWKFEILHVDAAALAFDDKTGTDRKAAREATDFGTHGILRFNGVTPNAVMTTDIRRQFRGAGPKSARILWVACGQFSRLRGPVARQTARPFCSASALSDVCGRAPICWITSAAASAPSRAAAR